MGRVVVRKKKIITYLSPTHDGSNWKTPDSESTWISDTEFMGHLEAKRLIKKVATPEVQNAARLMANLSNQQPLSAARLKARQQTIKIAQQERWK